MTEHDTRQRLHLDILHRVALNTGKVAHLRLRERDVIDHLLGQRVVGCADVLRAQAEIIGTPLVELQRVFASRVIAAGSDVGYNGLHGRPDLGVGHRGGALGDAGLEVTGQSSPFLEAF